MLDYKLLEAMVAAVQEGGFEKAAQVLHLTQPAVSHRVKLLEELTGLCFLCDLRASVWDHKKIPHKAAENTEALFSL